MEVRLWPREASDMGLDPLGDKSERHWKITVTGLMGLIHLQPMKLRDRLTVPTVTDRLTFPHRCTIDVRTHMLGFPRSGPRPDAVRGTRGTAFDAVRGTRGTASDAVRGTRGTASNAVRGFSNSPNGYAHQNCTAILCKGVPSV